MWFLNTKYEINDNVKKVSIVVFILFIFFILSISIPQLASTRDDAIMAQRAYIAQQESNTVDNKSTNDYKIISSLFETKRYEIKYQTNNTNRLREKIKELKQKVFVSFDTYNESKEYSEYIIKVKRENSQEVLVFLETLLPYKVKLYVENIKKSIDATFDKKQLLNIKLSKLEDILNDAINSYTILLKLAKDENNLETLTKLVDLKINTLNRLTNEKSIILEEIDSITKNRQELLDKVNYVIFKIEINEFLYIDLKQFKNSWKYEVRSLVNNINSLIQNLSISLLSFIIQVIEFVIYFILILFLLKILLFIIKKIFKLENLLFLIKEKNKD